MFRDCEKMESIKLDLLPHIVKKQFPSSRRLKKSREFWRKMPPEDAASLRAPMQLIPISKEHGKQQTFVGFCAFWTESVFVWLTEGHGVWQYFLASLSSGLNLCLCGWLRDRVFDSTSWLFCLLNLICACVTDWGTGCLTVLPGFCVFWT